jgi:hypothetical protein
LFQTQIPTDVCRSTFISTIIDSIPYLVFYLKYVVHWASDNEIGLANGSIAASLDDYYNAAWAAEDSKSIMITMPASGPNPETPIIALTPSLSGESTHLYNFDIHINATEKE